MDMSNQPYDHICIMMMVMIMAVMMMVVVTMTISHARGYLFYEHR
jgi:hypothetical protein